MIELKNPLELFFFIGMILLSNDTILIYVMCVCMYIKCRQLFEYF